MSKWVKLQASLFEYFSSLKKIFLLQTVGAEKIWRCRFAFGCAVALLRLFHVLELDISLENFIPTRFQMTKTRTELTLLGWRKVRHSIVKLKF
jgi:hypothetical protein